eukprot:s900_g8.t1
MHSYALMICIDSALTGELLPLLEKAPSARVVVVSSTAHLGANKELMEGDLMAPERYTQWGAYCQSKLANVLFAKELNRRFQEDPNVILWRGSRRTSEKHRNAMAGIALTVASSRRPEMDESVDEPMTEAMTAEESLLTPRQSYYDMEASFDLYKRGIQVPPNRLLHDYGLPRAEVSKRRIEARNGDDQPDCSKGATITEMRPWWQMWKGWSSKLAGPMSWGL